MTTPAKVKLVQCWDDGILDDIRLTEILRKHKATASFNLNPGLHKKDRYHEGWHHKDKLVWRLSAPELPKVYEGFLAANHSARHPHLTRLPAEEAVREINEGRDMLEQMFGYAIEGFAYPYGDQNEDVRQMVKAAGHVYARGCDNVPIVFPPENRMDFRPSCHFLAPDFWPRFEAVKQTGGVFYFWGHSYEIMGEDDWRAFDEQIQRLGEQGEWVTLPSLFHET